MTPESVDLSVEVGPLHLRNPVVAASGTVGYGEELRAYLDWSAVGGLVGKTITLHPRAGNAPPRTAETPSGLLNSIGLQNEGLDSFVSKTLPQMRRLGTAVIVNIGGADIAEFRKLAEAIGREGGVDAIELNISCPNVLEGGMFLDRDPDRIRSLMREVRSVTDLPLIAKLTPNVSDILEIARAAMEGGAAILSVANTYFGLAVDWRARRPLVASGTGGVSGPAIKPLSLKLAWEVAQTLKVPVMGIGGILTAKDALEYIVAGCAAVQVGTANFLDPSACARIAEEMRGLLAQAGIGSVREIIGTLKMPAHAKTGGPREAPQGRSSTPA